MWCLLVGYLLVPTVVVVTLGALWTWRLAFERPDRRALVRATLAALALGVVYPLPLAGWGWLAWRATYLPFELVLPDGYVGQVLIVACAGAGDEPGGQLVLPPNGIARIRVDPDELAGRTNVDARTASGRERTVYPYTTDLPGGGCGWFEYAVLPGPDEPQHVPFSNEDLRTREARALAEGRSFAEVSADPPPPPSDTDPP